MNLVSLALRRPISLLTMVIAVALVGFLAVDRMSRDIFPDLGVPVLYVAQPYGGMDPAQMEGFIVNYYEYHSSTSPASSMSKANRSRASA
jgi:multidrug efflux pump subunit AcrB